MDDVIAGAEYLIEAGLVDPKRICIDGISAGGLTTLAALGQPNTPITAGTRYARHLLG